MNGPTPGPWFGWRSEHGMWTIQEPCGWIAEMTKGRPNEQTNARLIVAAPELLEIVRRVAIHFEGTDSPLGIAAAAAIAKATGEEVA